MGKKICGHCKKEIKIFTLTKCNKTSTWCKKCYDRHQINLAKYNAKIAKRNSLKNFNVLLSAINYLEKD